jgi:large subunit ribosomal protein L24
MAGLRIRKGDRVRVLTGKDRGKEGVVMRAIPEKNKVIVVGVNMAKRHQKARTATSQGGIID